MDLAFVGHRCCDHSPSGGYDQVCALFPSAGWLDGRALADGRLEWHREPGAEASNTPRLFHVFYGDCSGKPLPRLLRERFPDALIVSSAHQPVSRLQQDAQALDALRISDAILTVSALQASELRHLDLGVPVEAVPHGVWTRVFRPEARWPDARDHVLLVGSFLRDWDTARRIIAGLAAEGVRSVALGAGSRAHLSSGEVPVDVRPFVPEAELAAMYDRAAAVCLPFLEATASNALLEAMAAGCPVICPRLPSLVDEYLGDDLDAFGPGHPEAAVARLLHYVRHPDARAARSRVLTTRVAPLDWAHLKPRYAAVYEAVAARRPGRRAEGPADVPARALQRSH